MNHNREDDIAARKERQWSDLGEGLGHSRNHLLRDPLYGDPMYGDHWRSFGNNNEGGASGMRPVDTAAPREQWKGRRRMAWVALVAVLSVTALAIFYIPIDRLDVLTDIIMWFFVTMGSIIGAYMGFTAWWASRTSNRK